MVEVWDKRRAACYRESTVEDMVDVLESQRLLAFDSVCQLVADLLQFRNVVLALHVLYPNLMVFLSLQHGFANEVRDLVFA